VYKLIILAIESLAEDLPQHPYGTTIPQPLVLLGDRPFVAGCGNSANSVNHASFDFCHKLVPHSNFAAVCQSKASI